MSLEMECAEQSIVTLKFKFTEFCFTNYVEIIEHFTGTRSHQQKWLAWSDFFHFISRKPGVTFPFCR